MLAILERLVGGADESRYRGPGNLDPPNDQLLSTLRVDVFVSLVSGGVVWLDEDVVVCFLGAPNSYEARLSRIC